VGVNVVTYGGKTLVDMRNATATENTVFKGYIAYGADGEPIIGAAEPTRRRETTISLPLGGWTDGEQTVTVLGVTADATVIIGGDPGSDYNEFEVYCSGQGNGTLTFVAPYQPNGDLTANAVILT